ncbi:hypothetical protein M23134_04085 [Microscilla marina ATCC 23134]|uniref:Uncharacterized protein n=1 Tax=Microscilla marina ATCC 23134 TaxID=313606 RepID=A1ZDU4_MICM2|nr:hypothetical protein M23134_04085 [Microscilla marina ATCC 23134]
MSSVACKVYLSFKYDFSFKSGKFTAKMVINNIFMSNK